MADVKTDEKNVQVISINPQLAEDEVDVSVVDFKDDPGDKKLLRKLDLYLLPVITLLYMLSYLDRVNIGQAKLDGLSQSLHLTSNQYNNCLCVFFVTFVVFEIPSNLILKRVRPSRWISLNMVVWGIIMTLMGLVKTYGGLLACRLFLGVAEAGLFPGANFYLSGWYKRRELSWRISFLFSGLALAGAFGGILAYGIGHMNGIGGQAGWQWIFYIEGMVTVVVGALSYFFIMDFPSDRSKFLTESECSRVITRVRLDAGPGADEHFSWKQVGATFLDWKVYVWSLCYLGIAEPFKALSLFLPTIIQDLGYINSEAQLLTAPPYVFAFFTTMITAYFSDKYARRSIFIIFWLIITSVGFIILIAADNSSVKYFAVFLTTGGIIPCVATCITFLSCNISPHTKRATAVALMLSVGNSTGTVSSQIYRSQDSPRFILGHSIDLGFCVLGLISCIILLVGLHLENRRRDRLYGPVTTGKVTDVFGLGTDDDRRRWGYENMSEKEICDLGDRHVAWRYIL